VLSCAAENVVALRASAEHRCIQLAPACNRAMGSAPGRVVMRCQDSRVALRGLVLLDQGSNRGAPQLPRPIECGPAKPRVPDAKIGSCLEQRHGRILRQGNAWPEVYIFSYITEGSFDGYSWQTIESKARFIEQALAGEITARTAEDTSEVVLSAAEIKAIASGNPQIVRKVQLEAEVARLDRVRSVWLDTRRNLQLERHFTQEEIRRIEGRRAQWERAATIVGTHPHEPFCAEVATTIGGATIQSVSGRAEAGAIVRCLVHEYQSAAAFQRQRLRGVVARYRGLDLVVQAHAVFAADLSLTLPDGAALDAVTAATDSGVWQSVSRTISDIPSVLERLTGRIAEARERIATIDRELARLNVWDGQTSYDAAVSELGAINAVFAAIEEQADLAQPATITPTTVGTSRPAATTPSDEPALADLLLALAQEERAAEGLSEWQPLIPPAPQSLACMAAEGECQEVQAPLKPERLRAEESEAVGALKLSVEGGQLPAMHSPHLQVDKPASQRCSQSPRASNAKAEVTQLSLF
jgi:hypothetical protein